MLTMTSITDILITSKERRNFYVYQNGNLRREEPHRFSLDRQGLSILLEGSMETKVCGKCGKEKLITNFYKHNKNLYQGYCKDCAKEIGRNYNKTKKRKEYIRLLARKHRSERKKYFAKPEVKKLYADSAKKRNKTEIYKFRNTARRTARTALCNGTLKKQPCQDCGSVIKIEKHHEDYNKPLDVIWLCVQCHRDRHFKDAQKGKDK